MDTTEREGDFLDNFSVEFANREHYHDELTSLIWVLWPYVCMYVKSAFFFYGACPRAILHTKSYNTMTSGLWEI